MSARELSKVTAAARLRAERVATLTEHLTEAAKVSAQLLQAEVEADARSLSLLTHRVQLAKAAARRMATK